MTVTTCASLLTIALMSGAGCSRERGSLQAAQSNPRAAAAPVESPHGDHNPHHGGVVFMHGDVHFEVVLDRGGHHRVFLSDSVRADLPASAASEISIAITRAGRPGETLTAAIDEAGESWVAEGPPIGGEASARISLTTADGPYWIDTPVLPPAEGR